MALDIPGIVIDMPPETQLRRVLREVLVYLPFHIGVGTPDDVHLEVRMYVVDRDHHRSGPRPPAPRGDRPESWGPPYVFQILSFDMSDEVLALRQARGLERIGDRAAYTLDSATLGLA